SQQLFKLLMLFRSEGRRLRQSRDQRAIGAKLVQVLHQLLNGGSRQSFCSGRKELDGTPPAFNECSSDLRLAYQVLSAIAKELRRRSVARESSCKCLR